ncbi:hypothetical protein GE061_016851 [Apolygus lucorum]|uniref:Uncharacterized protein n=1 Tax=Apolygus lucorum TaxID=248454 RepID=A0A8S9XHG3_APOLU|nr:hypothetical protein GE061_016851 [Apolygus lucorum]
MIDTSGLVVMGVGIVSVMVVNLFVNKSNRKCPQNSMSLQAYSGPDDFPLPIPDSIFKQSGDFLRVEPLEANRQETTNFEEHVVDKQVKIPPTTNINPPPATPLSATNPFVQKLDVKDLYSQDSLAYHSTTKLDWETSSTNTHEDETVHESSKTENTTSSIEDRSHGDSVSQHLPKDSSSYSTSVSWEDAFVEREPFIDPMERYHKKMPGTTKNKKL